MTSVKVTLDTPIPLTWIRLVVKDTAELNNNNIILSYQENGTDTFVPCENIKVAKVSDKILDMVCETKNTVEGIMLQGPVVNNLCSLYISKGRNIALKQPATQSTKYLPFFASNAVDGRLDKPNNIESQAATCSHTDVGLRGWWKVTFPRPVKIAMFFLYNRRSYDHENILQNIMYAFAKIPQAICCGERLMNFELTVLSEDTREPVFNYTDPQKIARDVYTVVPPTIISDAREVKIEAARDRDILTLCEVKVFGEVSCPRGWFGLACENQCNCVNQTGCFVHSGRCTSGCAVGYTGEDCKSSEFHVGLTELSD
ncbi:fucolectin-related protein [Elysia marginata]|uniref:Fucolectin-related protein n=1 Tax=Elysia marginata TaxID=1093978 RepID=A0AAV4IDE5_9GAST|nr:fucolectin-related protein [Elysia marginata]